MDPASAAVAVIGFAASVAQLTSLAVASCKALHGFCKDTSDAPKNVERLIRLLGRLELVAKRMHTTTSSTLNRTPDHDVVAFWKQHALEMEGDLRTFRDKVVNLERGFRNRDRSLKTLFARLRVVFSDDETVNVTAESILARTECQSTKVDKLLASTQSLQARIESESAGYQILASLKRDAGIKVADSVAEGLKYARDLGLCDEDAHSLAMLKNLPITDSCLGIHNPSQRDYSSGSGFLANERPEQEWSNGVVFTRTAKPASYRRPTCSALSTKASWQLSIYQYPVGVLTVYQTESTSKSEPIDGQQSAFSITFSLFPATWLARVALKLSVELKFPRFGSPSLQTHFDHAAYNDDPEVLRCLAYADVDGFCRLLHDGRARATDLLPRSGNSLLHEVVFSYMAGREGALSLCHLLLQHGADPNSRNASGKSVGLTCGTPCKEADTDDIRTPLLACCRLMRDTIEHGERMRPMASALIEHGANLAICDDAGYSACSLIFQCRTGLQFLQSFVYRYVDLFTMQEMASSDAWILASLARFHASFRARLDAEFHSYRTAPILSCSRYQKQYTMVEIDAEHQTAEVRRGSAVARITFLNALCTNGTKEMVMPFLDCGIDLNERMPRQSTTYVRSAAKQGNLEVVAALVDSGASQYTEAETYMGEKIGPVDELLERWYALHHGIPEYFGDPENEIWILPKLLLNDTFDGANVLFKAVETMQPDDIFKLLLDAGCGLRDRNPAVTWKQKTYGSEVIEAIKCNSSMLELMLSYGLALERQDRLGYTALLHALDRGPGVVDAVQLLIAAGADLTQRTASGYTPLEFAKRNLDQKHPRRPRASWTVGKSHTLALQSVTLDADRAAYDALVQALRERYGNDYIPVGYHKTLLSGIWSRISLTGSLWQSTYNSWIKLASSGTPLGRPPTHAFEVRLRGLAGLMAMLMVLLWTSVWNRIWTLCYTNKRQARVPPT